MYCQESAVTFRGNYVHWNRLIDNQRQMARRVRELCRCAHEVLRQGEVLDWKFDDDGLGVRIGVRSVQPERLLEQIHQAHFATFEVPGIQIDANRLYWTHFRLC
jgi:hypothetical protein